MRHGDEMEGSVVEVGGIEGGAVVGYFGDETIEGESIDDTGDGDEDGDGDGGWETSKKRKKRVKKTRTPFSSSVSTVQPAASQKPKIPPLVYKILMGSGGVGFTRSESDYFDAGDASPAADEDDETNVMSGTWKKWVEEYIEETEGKYLSLSLAMK